MRDVEINLNRVTVSVFKLKIKQKDESVQSAEESTDKEEGENSQGV